MCAAQSVGPKKWERAKPASRLPTLSLGNFAAPATKIMAALTLLLCWTGAAHADLKLCNRTSYILYAATSQVSGANSQTQGWTRLAPGDCALALKGPINHQSTLVYARSSLAHSGPQRAWGGEFPSCVRDANFSLHQTAITSCATPGSFSAPFAAVDSRGKPDFTMNFDEQPTFKTLIAAQLAGVKRLLKDNGYAVGAINGSPDKATGKALTAFRAAQQFTPASGNPELFAALEREAQKKTAPSGYTVCNDGKDEILVAIGEVGARGETSRGWWRVAGGACARTITTPLTADAVWLLAQKTNGTMVAGGLDKFCVTAQEFEIQKRGNCAARSLAEAGFAKTATRGLAGYVAHITANGLATNQSQTLK